MRSPLKRWLKGVSAIRRVLRTESGIMSVQPSLDDSCDQSNKTAHRRNYQPTSEIDRLSLCPVAHKSLGQIGREGASVAITCVRWPDDDRRLSAAHFGEIRKVLTQTVRRIGNGEALPGAEPTNRPVVQTDHAVRQVGSSPTFTAKIQCIAISRGPAYNKGILFPEVARSYKMIWRWGIQ
jgi:hypothetical protein